MAKLNAFPSVPSYFEYGTSPCVPPTPSPKPGLTDRYFAESMFQRQKREQVPQTPTDRHFAESMFQRQKREHKHETKNKNKTQKQVTKESSKHKRVPTPQNSTSESSATSWIQETADEVKAVITRGECLDKHVGQSKIIMWDICNVYLKSTKTIPKVDLMYT